MKRRSTSSLSLRILLLIVLCLTGGATRPGLPADAAPRLAPSLTSLVQASGGNECVPVVFVHGITGSFPGVGSNLWFGAPQYPLFQLLEANGYKENETLFRFAYNWFHDNSSSAAHLGNYIEDTVKDSIQRRIGVRPQHVSILAHSMGGFVTRRYLTTAGTNGVDKVMTIGSPYGGSAEAIARWLGRATGNLFNGPGQLLPTWQAVYDQYGNPVPDNGGFGYNTWVHTNVWPAPQPDVAFYSRSFDTARTITRTEYIIYDPEFGPMPSYTWERRSYIPSDQTVDWQSGTTSVGSTRMSSSRRCSWSCSAAAPGATSGSGATWTPTRASAPTATRRARTSPS